MSAISSRIKQIVKDLVVWSMNRASDATRSKAIRAANFVLRSEPDTKTVISRGISDTPIVPFEREDPNDLAARILAAHYDVVSFDLFDTLVLRAYDEPRSIVKLWGLVHDRQYANEARTESMEALRKEGSINPSFLEIHNEMERRTGIDADEGMATELALELEHCVANPYLMKVYNQLKAAGQRIIITSDMYLPSEAIKRILEHCGYDGYEAIYVSNEQGASKSSGELYRLEKECYGEGKYLHIGDNEASDVKRACELGWDAVHYPNINVINGSPFKLKMSPLVGSLYRGTVNRMLYAGSVRNNPFYDIGYAHFGLPIYGFCQWLDSLASSQHIDLLLFAARDMWITHKVFSMFSNRSAEYLPVSRAALMRADFSTALPYLKSHLIAIGERSAPKVSSYLISQHEEFLFPWLEKTGMDLNAQLDKETALEIYEVLLNRRHDITQKFAGDQECALEFYKALLSGHPGSKRILFVDFNGRGSTQAGIASLMKTIDPHIEIIGAYYYNRSTTLQRAEAISKAYSYLFSLNKNTDLLKDFELRIKDVYNTFELFFAISPEGTLLSYGSDAGGGDLIFGPLPPQADKLYDLCDGVVDFCEEFACHAHVPGLSSLRVCGRDAYWPFVSAANALKSARTKTCKDIPCEN